MRFVICSDAHLDASTDGFPRFDDVAAALDETVEAAKRLRADGWMFLGDLCDPDSLRSHAAVAKAMRVAARLHAEEIDSYWLAGNHDVIEDGRGTTTLSALASSGIFGCNVFELPTRFIHGGRGFGILALPYTARAKAYDPADFVRRHGPALAGMPTLVIGHLNLEGITPGSETVDMPRGRDVFWPLAAIEECMPGAVLLGGHIHRRQHYRGVQIVGDLVRLSHGEEDHDPGYLVVEF